MSFWDILGTLLIKPLQLLFEVVFVMANRVVGDPGPAIIALSLAMNFLVLPLYRRADAMQEEERETELRLHKGVAHIKKTFRGDERMMMLQTYYRQNNYKPTYVLKGATSLFLEIRFSSRPTPSSRISSCCTACPSGPSATSARLTACSPWRA